MLIPEIKPTIVNQVLPDPYGRVSAVLLINKPIGLTSHDVVATVRRVLRTKRVGHAGALDPFASGVLVVLVGKFTKYTDALINLDKSYKADVVLGVRTDTQDPEGQLISSQAVELTNYPELASVKLFEQFLQHKFRPGYEQLVPIYSSVKVEGEKLRVLAREAAEIEYLADDMVAFSKPGVGGKLQRKVVKLPRKSIKINGLWMRTLSELDQVRLRAETVKGQFISVGIEVDCSKGTYIRQLAEDIGAVMQLPSFLNSLARTRVGEFDLAACLELEDLPTLTANNKLQ